MSEAPSTSSGAPSSQPLQQAVVRGSAWTIFQATAAKIVTAAGMWAMAAFLSPQDFGVYAKALTILVAVTVLIPQCVGDVLVQRNKNFDRSAGLASALSLASGALVAILCIAISPFLHTADGVDVPLVLAVLGFRPLATAFQIVPASHLRLQMRFGALARRALAAGILGTVTGVAAAALGAGAVALPIGSIVAFATEAHLLARISDRPLARPRLSGDPRLLRDFVSVSIAQYLHNLTLYSDYAVLAAFAETTEVGLYYFAFQLSMQVNALLTHSLGRVLLPALTHLHSEEASQRDLFLRSLRIMLTIAVPIALLQGALARPLVLLAFHPKWADSAQLVTMLSIAQCFYAACGPAAAMLKAQGRFAAWTAWQGFKLLLMVPALIIACAGADTIAATDPLDEAEACAAVVVLTYAISGPVGVWLALGRGRGAAMATLRAFRGPVLAGTAMMAAATAPEFFVDKSSQRDAVIQLLAVPLPALIIYLAILRVTDVETHAAIWWRLRKVLGFGRGRSTEGVRVD